LKPAAQAEAHGWYNYQDEKTADYDLRDGTLGRFPVDPSISPPVIYVYITLGLRRQVVFDVLDTNTKESATNDQADHDRQKSNYPCQSRPINVGSIWLRNHVATKHTR
jgi:hypothetical protein